MEMLLRQFDDQPRNFWRNPQQLSRVPAFAMRLATPRSVFAEMDAEHTAQAGVVNVLRAPPTALFPLGRELRRLRLKLTQLRLNRGVFHSVADLGESIYIARPERLDTERARHRRHVRPVHGGQ